jgi:uncharacterized membrane protein YccC
MILDRRFAPPAIRREHFGHMFRLAGACALAYGGATLIGLPEGYWSLITAIVVTQAEFNKTWTASRDRVVATLIGAALGFLVLEASDHGAPKLLLFTIALAPLLALTAIMPNLRMSGVTLIVVALVPSTGGPFLRPFDRVVEILLGVFASLVVAAATGSATFWRRRSGSRWG